MATSKTDKKVDMPPKGDRNPDPITDEAGAHPIETGAGAALAGAAAGLAVGAVTGPVGAAIGAAVGAVAGGLAGKGIGEWIDPTEDDDYLESNFTSRPYVKKGDKFETYRDAYRFGGRSETSYGGKPFDEVCENVRTEWDKSEHAASMPWDRAQHAIRDAYDRTIQLREEKVDVTKTPVKTGEVKVGKRVVTETKTIEVPVEREELVIERRAASGRADLIGANDAEVEEINIPLTEERVSVDKHAVVKEEVKVGKKTVRETESVPTTVRHEELQVEDEVTGQACDTTTSRKSKGPKA